MIRQFRSLCLVLLFLVVLVFSNNTVKAEENIFVEDNIKYQILQEPIGDDYGTCLIIGGRDKNIKSLEICEIVGYREDIKNAYKVVGIVDGAFKNYKKLKVVEFSESDFYFKSIPADCFNGCKSLKKVDIEGPALKTIGKRAFKGCKKLSYIRFSTKLLKKKSFGRGAFSGVPAGLKVEGPTTAYSIKYADLLKKCGVKNPKGLSVYNGPPKDDWGDDWGSD